MNQTKGNKLKGLGYSGALTDMELAYYKANGATSNNLSQAKKEWAAFQGGGSGGAIDAQNKVYVTAGHSGSLNDKLKKFWT